MFSQETQLSEARHYQVLTRGNEIILDNLQKKEPKSYLLISPDILQILEQQIPDYKNAFKEYAMRVNKIKEAMSVDPKDIFRAYKKRQPLIYNELEQHQQVEIDAVNNILLEAPARPILLGEIQAPEVVLLNDTLGVGISIDLENISHFKESKKQVGVVIGMLPESKPINFEGQLMSPKVYQARGLDKRRILNIITNEGEKIVLRGVSPNECSAKLD